ncbi:nuclear mRNA export, poly(A)+RNA binding protein [Elasticomyces elasticus]|nr:nuclear mRNA export, poly(A)+RNA binding protein [Elasticomyces elasticus]
MTSTSVVTRRHHNSSAPRGGVARRRGNPLRPDRDGDLVMDSSAASARGRGKIRKSRGSDSTGRDVGARPSRGGINTTRLQKEIIRHVLPCDAVMRAAPAGPRSGRWTNSKASDSNDGGVSSLIIFLEKKASMRTGHPRRTIKIKKSRVDGQDLFVTLNALDADALQKVNGFHFAGSQTPLSIVRLAGGNASETQPGPDKEKTLAMLKSVLERRYNPELKLLNLSALGADQALRDANVFGKTSTTSKFFPALMVVLEQQFKSGKERNEAVESVTLARNELASITAVTTLAQTLPLLKNLDLSDNLLPDIAALEPWRRKFQHLDHLILTNNPIEQTSDYAMEVLKWYPRLRILNATQVRTDEEAARGTSTAIVALPFPIKTASFQDEGQIAENFIRTFFIGFDSDRATLASHYYDNASDFSLSINTAAPRDPADQGLYPPQEWERYIKKSRNLKKIQHLPARVARHSRGTQAVQEIWATLPATKHPDLAAEAGKWLIECASQPGVPDPSGQFPAGVDGFLVTIHGEFDEIDASAVGPMKKRSFDRSFVIGPGGPLGVRVVNDMLTIRAYGGTQAFEPEEVAAWSAQEPTALAVPVLPAGVTTEVAEQMILELQKQTAMTVAFSKDCLEQCGWDFAKAMETFTAVKPNLGLEAFVQPQ